MQEKKTLRLSEIMQLSGDKTEMHGSLFGLQLWTNKKRDGE